MVNKKNLVIIICVLALAAAGTIGYKYIDCHKDIETMSAKLEIETEEVEANSDGTIKSIKYENLSKVQVGDVIAEIAKPPVKTNCTNDKVSQKAKDDYNDAVLMYKDGIITKDEYDTSLNKYKTEKKKSCSANMSELDPVYAEQDGILILNDEYKAGSPVKDDDIIGTIRSEKVLVNAYFSPKVSKRIKAGKNALITIIKYPEKQFTGTVSSIEKIDINGQSVKIEITDDTSDLNITSEDSAIVKILNK